jgi:acyl-CoA dehydrogenase
VADRTFLAWPFFEERHQRLADEAGRWAAAQVRYLDGPEPRAEALDARCRDLVRALGESGWLRLSAPDDGFDVRSLCLLRETLAYHDGLADFAFAMQGLGSGPVVLFGTPEQRARHLDGTAEGRRIMAFAISEPDAGSDVAAITTTACRDGDSYVLDGTKTWISNAGIAQTYVVFARTGAPESGARGLSAFVVETDDPGFSVAERIEVSAPHPLGTLRFERCRIPADRRLSAEGEGFKVAMSTLDVFRATVGAAALGFARRALDEATGRATSRQLFGRSLAELQMTQHKLADMALDVDASALLVYRAAWTRDVLGQRVTREAAMAKLYATEAAQRVVDQAVQLFGGLGVTVGSTVERLSREVRALRIYEGASEVQQVVIARQVLSGTTATRL